MPLSLSLCLSRARALALCARVCVCARARVCQCATHTSGGQVRGGGQRNSHRDARAASPRLHVEQSAALDSLRRRHARGVALLMHNHHTEAIQHGRMSEIAGSAQKCNSIAVFMHSSTTNCGSFASSKTGIASVFLFLSRSVSTQDCGTQLLPS